MFFRLWREHSGFRDLVDLLFISEYELYKPPEERSERAKAINNGEMLIAGLVAELVPTIPPTVAERSLDRTERLLSLPFEFQTKDTEANVNFKSFRAISDEDLAAGTKEELRPEIELMKRNAIGYHFRKYDSKELQDKPTVFGFLQIHLPSAQHCTIFPFALTERTIRQSLKGFYNTDIPLEFLRQAPAGPLPYSVETLLK